MSNIEEFARDLGVISNYFKKRMHSAKFDNCNIKDCMTIEALSQNDLSMLELADILNLSPSATTTHIDRLIGHGVVDREHDKDDRRKVLIRLSKKGKAMANLINLEHFEISKELLNTLDKSEVKEFTKLIKKVAGNLPKDD